LLCRTLMSRGSRRSPLLPTAGSHLRLSVFSA
ncbi:hypothetical protein KIPB_014632, partial [Kipferlia bialata]